MMLEKDSEKPFNGLKQIRKFYGNNPVSYQDFTFDEILQFRNLNDRLLKFENILKQEVETLHAYAKSRVENKNDSLCCFYIEIDVYFYLEKNNPAYEQDEDNIITILYTTKEEMVWEFGFGDKNNHNTLTDKKGTPMEYDKHCSLLHALYEHTDLYYQELLMIGELDFHMNLCLDYDADTKKYFSMVQVS